MAKTATKNSKNVPAVSKAGVEAPNAFDVGKGVVVEVVGKRVEIAPLPPNVSPATLDVEIHNRAIVVWKAINPKQVEKLEGNFEAVPASTVAKIKEAVRDALGVLDDEPATAPVTSSSAATTDAKAAPAEKPATNARAEAKAAKAAAREAKKAERETAKTKKQTAKTHPYLAAKKGFVTCYRELVAARDKSKTDDELRTALAKVAEIARKAMAELDAIPEQVTLAEVRG